MRMTHSQWVHTLLTGAKRVPACGMCVLHISSNVHPLRENAFALRMFQFFTLSQRFCQWLVCSTSESVL